MPAPAGARERLGLVPRHNHFVGIDSDGCAFDAMEIKHKECFIPTTIKVWSLQPASTLVRETAEFVNLYSTTRGLNRWHALVRLMDLLRERSEVVERVEVPRLDRVREFIASGAALSNPGLRGYLADHPDPELERALTWSQTVDAAIADMVVGVPPFPEVRETLATMAQRADLMVVSATPVEALSREWTEHGLAPYMSVIAGQEQGSKAQHLEQAAVGAYPPDRVLLIGDAPGDRDAAASQGVLFYPINPGHEAASWRRLRDEAFDRFVAGTYAGAYQAALIAEFEALLPADPPWRG